MQYGEFAHIYDRLMEDVDYDAWAQYICALISGADTDVKRIVDCGCGTGAVTLRLKRLGYDVTGVDISQQMLGIAAQNARNAGLAIPFVCMDMQKLKLHRPHDAVISACDGVNYLCSIHSVENFFLSAYESLKNGGLLIFDISSRYKLENILGCNTLAEDDGECAYIWKNMYDPKSKLIEMNLSFYNKKGEYYEKFCETHIQRAHSVDEIKNALKRVGFELVCVYQAFTKTAPDAQSQRIQFVAKKPVI